MDKLIDTTIVPVTRVDLRQSNGGQLFAISRSAQGEILGGWGGFESADCAGTAGRDAAAILAGQTSDWTLPQLTAVEARSTAELTESFAMMDATDAALYADPDRCGVAARVWLGSDAIDEA